MKHFCFLLFLILLSACVNSNTSHDSVAVASTSDSEQTTNNTQYVIANIVDSIVSANPDYLDNDIKRNRVATAIQSAILSAVSNNHSVLTEIPLTFEQLMQNGANKYIVKFELSNIGNSGTRISNKYDIYFNVFTEMTENEASELVKDKKYHLSFRSIEDVSNKLVLPSGRTFYNNPNIYITSLDDKPSVNPGGFLLRGVTFSE